MTRFFVLIICLSALAVMAKAQVSDDNKKLQPPDTIKSAADDYEEWLRNEPLKPDLRCLDQDPLFQLYTSFLYLTLACKP